MEFYVRSIRGRGEGGPGGSISGRGRRAEERDVIIRVDWCRRRSTMEEWSGRRRRRRKGIGCGRWRGLEELRESENCDDFFNLT